MQCTIKGVPATCDVTSANHKLFGIHFGLTLGHEFNVVINLVCQTIHFSSKHKRYIYVISNPPHLLKTTRYCLNIPGSGKGLILCGMSV